MFRKGMCVKNENIHKNDIENFVTYIFIHHNHEFYYRKCGSKDDFQGYFDKKS